MSVSDTYRHISALHDVDAIVRAATITKRRTDLDMSTAYEPAVTSRQSWLQTTWREVLEIDEVGIDDNFFELGGDSLQVAQMLARIVSPATGAAAAGDGAAGREVPIEVFLEGPTIRQLAACLDTDRRDGD